MVQLQPAFEEAGALGDEPDPDEAPELVMPESLRLAAYKPLKRMLDWS